MKLFCKEVRTAFLSVEKLVKIGFLWSLVSSISQHWVFAQSQLSLPVWPLKAVAVSNMELHAYILIKTASVYIWGLAQWLLILRTDIRTG